MATSNYKWEMGSSTDGRPNHYKIIRINHTETATNFHMQKNELKEIPRVLQQLVTKIVIMHNDTDFP